MKISFKLNYLALLIAGFVPLTTQATTAESFIFTVYLG